MADEPLKSDSPAPPSYEEAGGERQERKLTDVLKKAMSAGLGVASRSKDDFVRAAASEVGAWLERKDVAEELTKALANMVLEVKAEIRFKPTADGGLKPEVSSEYTVKSPT